MSNEKSTNPKDAIGRTKPPLHLIPSVANIEEAMVMGLGARKYGSYNWRDHSVAATVYVSAAMRHLAQWLDGESTDPESGASHLAHVRACMGILLDAQALGKLVDDRPPAGRASALLDTYTAYYHERAAQDAAEQTQDFAQFAEDHLGVGVTPSPEWTQRKADAEDRAFTLDVGAPVLTGTDIQAVYELLGKYKGFDILSGGKTPTVVYLTPSVARPANVEYTSTVEVAVDSRDSTLQQMRQGFAEQFVERLGCHEDVSQHIAGGTSFPDYFIDQVRDNTATNESAPSTVYVAGPMRGYADFNYPAFHEARDRFLSLGYAVVSPADVDTAADGGDEHKYDHTQRSYVYRDLMTLMALGTDDAIAMLPGWESSTGAVAEFMVARWLGLRILDAETGEPLMAGKPRLYPLALAVREYLQSQMTPTSHTP